MADLLTPDLCVIGAGPGGLSVAAAAAAFGVPTVLIERDRMGGDCLHSGCVPSKALIAAARRVQLARAGAPLGLTASDIDADFAMARAHVQRTIAAIAPNDSVARFTGLGVTVIAGEARFTDARTVAVDERFEIKARRFVIATGSRPAVPDIPGLAAVTYYTNETIFDLSDCPQHLLVLGAGPVGLELAQAFARFGAKVTVIEAQTALAREDPECASIVLKALRAEGVEIRTGWKVLSVGNDNGIVLELQSAAKQERVTGSHLLVATGRRAQVDGLALDKAGIATTEKGIAVDRRLRTTNRSVYAIGDVVGGPQFTQLANYHAGLVVRNALFRLPVAVNDHLVARVTFTDPELAHVGLDEATARESHRHIRILRWPFSENDRAQADADIAGHIKVVTTRRGRILGATIVGPGAGELIAPWSLALAQGLHIRAMMQVVLPYPTRAEAGKRAAIEFLGPGLTNPWLRRIITFLRAFG